MRDRQGILDRLMVAADLQSESGLFVPLVEIAGDGRVIIENHRGIVQYARECIGIKVAYGTVLIQGVGLMLAKMTKEQIVICGSIEAVRLCRRGTR